MTIQQAIQKAYLEAVGKATAPTVGSNKYERLLDLADNLSKQWEGEQGVDWNSRYELVDIGTVTATDTYELDDSIRKLSGQEADYVTITNDDSTWYYDVVPVTRFRNYMAGGNDPWSYGTTKAVARIGRNLKFATPFVSTDAQFGGTITVPAYTYVDDITSGNDEVQVDDPLWLVYMMAAEYVRNDTVKQGQYSTLIAKANDRMEAMKRDNASQLESVINLTDMFGLGETW